MRRQTPTAESCPRLPRHVRWAEADDVWEFEPYVERPSSDRHYAVVETLGRMALEAASGLSQPSESAASTSETPSPCPRTGHHRTRSCRRTSRGAPIRQVPPSELEVFFLLLLWRYRQGSTPWQRHNGLMGGLLRSLKKLLVSCRLRIERAHG